MSFFKRKGEEASFPSCNVNGGEAETHNSTEQSLIRCSKLLQLCQRRRGVFRIRLSLITAVNSGSSAIASLFWLLYLG